MRVKDLWKKVLIAGVTAGSAMVIAACYGAYYGPRQAAVRGPVVHANQPKHGPVFCATRPAGGAPRCLPVDRMSGQTRARIQNTIENVKKDRSAPLAVAK